MVEFKGCPRCRGDVTIKQDLFGQYRECLQCGYVLDVPVESKIRVDWVSTREKPGRKRKVA